MDAAGGGSVPCAASSNLSLPSSLWSLTTGGRSECRQRMIRGVRGVSSLLTNRCRFPFIFRRPSPPLFPRSPLSRRAMSTSTSPASSTSSSPVSRLLPLLTSHSLTGYIIPSADAHQSEYVAACDLRRAFISGFTGSAGVALVLQPSASPTNKLWTDGRYFLQAKHELSNEWELMRQGLPSTPKLEDWLCTHLQPGSRVGVDPTTLSIAGFRALKDTCKDRVDIISTPNLVDLIWTDRPPQPSAPLILHPEVWTGESIQSKVDKLRQKLRDSSCYALIVTALDEVAYLLNLRGGDVPFNPVFFSYAVVTADDVALYVDPAKVTPEVKAHLGPTIHTFDYSTFYSAVTTILPHLSPTSRVWLDTDKTNHAIFSLFPDPTHIHLASSPVALMKSVKNEVELKGVRDAHIRDSVAMCQFLCWLEEEVEREGEGRVLTEVSIGDRLAEFRAEQAHFMGLSFSTIAGSGANGAIIHYHPAESTCAKVDKKHLLLLDSGGQYRDGTTDITRTLHLGTPTPFQRFAFTRVLQGHIALASAVFPPGTCGPFLDALARLKLWADGLDYGHGTGHGVGSFLNVHEGPIGISASVRSPSMLSNPLQVGNVITNEPGYYHDPAMKVQGREEEAFGVRIENVCIVVERDTQWQWGGRKMLALDSVSLTPISTKMMDTDLMTDTEIEWVNSFHLRCKDVVGPHLTGKAKAWLEQETQPISRR